MGLKATVAIEKNRNGKTNVLRQYHKERPGRKMKIEEGIG